MPITVDVHLGPQDLADALRRDVSAGLGGSPKSIPPKYFYDERGSQLFAEITRLPEYYPTRAETEILERRTPAIVEATGADTLVELGSGFSTKTRLLLDGFAGAGLLKRFVPFDVDETTLRHAAQRVDEEYGGIAVHAVVGDFERHLDKLPTEGTRLIAFLGSTIGNLKPIQRAAMLRTIADGLDRTDWFLLGIDLVKDADRLVAAYDDSAGVTAEFNRNVLRVVNRELGGTFLVDNFEHVALWDARNEWMDLRLRALGDQDVRIQALDMDVHFDDGEELRTEISTKFRLESLEEELRTAGLQLVHWWTDEPGDYALSMSRKA